MYDEYFSPLCFNGEIQVIKTTLRFHGAFLQHSKYSLNTSADETAENTGLLQAHTRSVQIQL